MAWFVKFLDSNEALGLRPGHSYLVGREKGADIRIDPPHEGANMISRRHALLTVRARGLEIVDLGSRNGTRVGLVRVPAGKRGMLLVEGAVVFFGNLGAEVGPLGPPQA